MRAARPVFVAGLSALASAAIGQVLVQGRVLDERGREPMAFVHVLQAGERQGATTGIDGRFELAVERLPTTLRFSFVGYEALTLSVSDAGPHVVRMRPANLELRPVEVLPGENPAHRIIKRVYANRKVNDGLRTRAHRYTSYAKTIFTAALDSAVLNDPEKRAALDSSDQKAMDFLERNHLLLVESATRRVFVPPASEKEEVIAMRVSGLKDPSMAALAASTSTFSLYEPAIELNEKNYLSPIGPSSWERYLFDLRDTLYQGTDTVFVIAYQPRSGRKFDALKGVLHVHTASYALQAVIAEPVERTGGFSIKLQQRFKPIAGTWFPVELNTFFYLDFAQVNTWKTMGVGRVYLKDLEVDAPEAPVPISRKETRGPAFVMDRIETRQDDALWERLRTDTLSLQERNTYQVIDSLSEAEGIERKVRWLGRMASGRAGIGPVDVLLDRLLHFNGYEGLRAGLGLATNQKVSRVFTLAGYGAYGFADGAWKYGGELRLRPRPGRSPSIRLAYANDVEESGGVEFRGYARPLLANEGYRLFYVDRMDRLERFKAEVAWRIGGLRTWAGTERSERVNLLGYQYARQVAEGITVLEDRWTTGALTLGLRYAHREKVARVPNGEFGLGTRWPVLYVDGWYAVKGLWQGALETWRVAAMVEKSFRPRLLGETSVRVVGFMADPRAPYPFLYNMRGTWSDRFPLAVRNTFETMRPNEFLADRHVSLHLRHSFGNLLVKGRKFKPVPVLVANAGWGALSVPELHRGFAFTPMRAYYEAGVQLDNLVRMNFTGFGIGAFYRLGPETLPRWQDNLALKLSLALGG